MRTLLAQHFGSSGRALYGGKYQLRGLHVLPDLAQEILDDAVISVIRAHAPEGQVVLTGDCDLTVNTTSGWHKDITDDMGLGNTVYADRGFGVAKLAIYLQDQNEASGSTLKVRPRSHVAACGDGLPEQRVPVRAGDVVVFDVRIDHAGENPSATDRALRRLTQVACWPWRADADAWFTRLRSKLLRITGREADRMAVFLTFGPADRWTADYERAGRHRHGPPPRRLCEAVENALGRHGVAVINNADGPKHRTLA